jgi:hypothetical protein
MGREGNGKSVGNCTVSTVSRGPIPLGDALYSRDHSVVPETCSLMQTEIQSPAFVLAPERLRISNIHRFSLHKVEASNVSQ